MKKNNEHYLSKAALAFCLSLLVINQSRGENKEPVKPAFTASQPISNGFVFIEGQYVEAPYIVSRKELSIFINNRPVANYAPLVREIPKPEDMRPTLPAEVATNSSPYDERVKKYMIRMQTYLSSHYKRDEIADEMEKAYRELPCVKDVHRNADKTSATVTYTDGNVINENLIPLTRKPAITPANAVEYVSRSCQNYVDRLEKGSFYSFSQGGSRICTFSADTAKGVMPNIVKVLRSSQDNEAKAKQLSEMLGMPEIPKEQAKTFVNNLSISKQLDDRAEALVKEDK